MRKRQLVQGFFNNLFRRRECSGCLHLRCFAQLLSISSPTLPCRGPSSCSGATQRPGAAANVPAACISRSQHRFPGGPGSAGARHRAVLQDLCLPGNVRDPPPCSLVPRTRYFSASQWGPRHFSNRCASLLRGMVKVLHPTTTTFCCPIYSTWFREKIEFNTQLNNTPVYPKTRSSVARNMEARRIAGTQPQSSGPGFTPQRRRLCAGDPGLTPQRPKAHRWGPRYSSGRIFAGNAACPIVNHRLEPRGGFWTCLTRTA